MAKSQPALAHHFDTLEQQHDASVLGMWVFLATEVLFFGGLFLAYTAYHSIYHEAFVDAGQHLNVLLGSINTGVLLCSSLTMALAVYSAQLDRRRALVGFLLLTMLLGIAFLGIKGVEYYGEYREHLVPALNFAYEGPSPQKAELFFVLYFFMTGLHAIHLTIGIGVVATITLIAWRSRRPAEHSTTIELIGLYWHFVDIVWVFLFPLLYLINIHH